MKIAMQSSKEGLQERRRPGTVSLSRMNELVSRLNFRKTDMTVDATSLAELLQTTTQKYEANKENQAFLMALIRDQGNWRNTLSSNFKRRLRRGLILPELCPRLSAL